MSQDDDPSDFIPPTIEEISKHLQAYEVLSFIAKGGMGAVYMATQRSLDRPVAIKILPRHFGEDAEFRASFEAEAKSMAKLNHPNLISIYDFGQVDGLLYIIMEMVQGKSLYHSAYEKKIAPTEAARIVCEICRGLANAHKHGILHRDIKPANILLDPSASPKIGDFGLARPLGEHEKDSAFGTPGYTAPEVLHNPRAVDESTDIYAVGVLLYELLTAKLPESIYDPVATLAKCHPKFDQIIRKATHPTPAMRFRTADALADALEPLMDKKTAANPFLATHTNKPNQGAAKTLVTLKPKSPTQTSAVAKLVTASSGAGAKLVTASSDAGAKLVTASSDAGAKLVTASSDALPPPSPASTPNITTGSNITLIRNIIIIVGLLAAILIAWEGLKKVRANRSIERALIEKEKMEARTLKQERLKQKQGYPKPKKPAQPKTNTFKLPEPKAETDLETLTRLKPLLKRGVRSDMPKGSIASAGKYRFHIKTPMSWHQAQSFCEAHGGHLPVMTDGHDLTLLTSKLGATEAIWLGAGTSGNKQWSWIDGSKWNMEIRNTSKAAFVAVDDTAILRPEPQQKKHTFFIEWNQDGSTPASLKNQLKRCAESLQSNSPSFPAGTIEYDNRHFLLVENSLDWNAARTIATLAGGTLAVPSNADENEWMIGFVTSSIQKGQTCWIGGLRKINGKWQWASGEPWQFARWAPNAPDDQIDYPAGCSIDDNQTWQDHPSNSKQSYYLIEWSKDGQGHQTVKTQVTTTNTLSQKRIKCANLINNLYTSYEKKFTSNIKGYEQELRSFSRSLPRGQQATYAPGLLQMRSRYVNNRIPEDIPRDYMPAKASSILDSRIKMQSRTKALYFDATEKIRKKYRSSLMKTAKEFKEKGLTSSLREVEDEISRTSQRHQSFIDYILGD